MYTSDGPVGARGGVIRRWSAAHDPMKKKDTECRTEWRGEWGKEGAQGLEIGMATAGRGHRAAFVLCAEWWKTRAMEGKKKDTECRTEWRGEWGKEGAQGLEIGMDCRTGAQSTRCELCGVVGKGGSAGAGKQTGDGRTGAQSSLCAMCGVVEDPRHGGAG